MTKQEKAAEKRRRKAGRVGASAYSVGNAEGGLLREATPTRKPKLGQLVADLTGKGRGALLGAMAAMRMAARMRRGQAR